MDTRNKFETALDCLLQESYDKGFNYGKGDWRAMKDKINKLEKVLTGLVNEYVANKGSDFEFICCITPRHAREMTPEERKNNPIWSLWDRARELLRNE